MSQWIKVEDNKPEYQVEVLLFSNPWISLGSMQKRCGLDYWQVDGEEERVHAFTHWMPLPEPPKEEI